MNEMMLVTIPKARKTLVNGQRLYEVGEHEFTVPEGVYSVCLNVLGAGGKLTYGSGWAVPGGSGGGGGGGGNNSITSGNVSTYGGGAGMLGMGGSGSYGLPGANGSILNATKAYGAGGGFNLPSGRPGAARIIWGEGRAYPSTRTADE